MKKIAFILCLLTGINSLRAQMVNYTIEENEVKEIKRISVGLDPFYVETNGGVNAAVIGAAVRGEINILKRLELKGDFRMAYLDGNSGLGEVSKVTGSLHPVCKGGTGRSKYFEAGAAFYFFDKTKTRNLNVVLHSSSGGGRTYKTSIHVPGERRRMFGVRGGLAIYSTGTQIGKTKSSLPDNQPVFTIQRDTSTMQVGDPTAATVDGSDVTYANTMVNSSLIYAGISLKSITNLIITADGYGTKKHQGVYDIYADYLICPYVSIKDVYTHGGQKWEVTHTKAGFKRAGWRFGVSYRSVSKFGLSYKFEVGERPGLYFGEKDKLINGNINLLLGIGFNVPFSKKHG